MIVTIPGRFGDILWGLPACRALSLQHGPVDLVIGEEFASLIPLLEHQPYLYSARALKGWGMDTWEAPLSSAKGEPVCHLGYRRWPELPLPFEMAQTVGVSIDLETPWIQVGNNTSMVGMIAVGFTEAWFELKYGLLALLRPQLRKAWLEQLAVPHGRWETEGHICSYSWLRAALSIDQCHVFFGDCSALHVLACALGKPIVIVEPMEARWNPIFYPYGMDGPQVTVVRGHDGKPTFDARHCADALRYALVHRIGASCKTN